MRSATVVFPVPESPMRQVMARAGINAVPHAHPELETWRSNFKGVRTLHERTNLELFGAIDAEVQALDPGVFSAAESRWAGSVASRLEALKESAGTGANDIIDKAKDVFTGNEVIDVVPDPQLRPQSDATLVIRRADGTCKEVVVTLRIDTPIEVDYYQAGGILPFVLRQLLQA